MNSLYVVTGQTATSKTRFALDLAQKYNGQLVNCDSRQIYKKLDIVTGKDLNFTDNKFHPNPMSNSTNIGYYIVTPPHNPLLDKEGKIGVVKNATRLWLYDIVDPRVAFSAHEFRVAAMKVITEILAQGKTPIVVGGTYFYLQELLYERSKERIPANWRLRKELSSNSVKELQDRLKKLSEPFFSSLNNSEKNNPQRLIRKIEILTKNPDYVENNVNYKFSPFFSKIRIMITGLRYKNKNDLHAAIKKRVEERLKNGAVDEVKKLIKQGYNEKNPGLKTIGYQQIFQYLNKSVAETAMIEDWITKEIQYAKRQYTFMKTDPNIHWITL